MIPSFLVLSWALTFGYIPSSSVIVYDNAIPHRVEQSGSFMQTVALGLTAWDTVTIWTNIETYDRMITTTSYAPFRSDYNIGLNVGHDVAGFRLDAGVCHECVHPVLSSAVPQKYILGVDTNVYIKISGKVGGK